jgi:hypothetical protein
VKIKNLKKLGKIKGIKGKIKEKLRSKNLVAMGSL